MPWDIGNWDTGTWNSDVPLPERPIPMAFDQTKRLKPSVLQKDIDAFAAIKTLTPAYAPSDARFTVALMTTGQTNMGTAQGTEVTKKGEFAAARDAANAAEWAFHNLVLGARDQVRAQYGEDSDQVQAIGLKKKSEYKRPGPRKPKTPTTP
jgi:hypothetical protein